MVRGGKYYLEQTLVLSHVDSGTQYCPVTYTAYPGEKPILSGGKRVTGWKLYKDKILQCELPEAKGGKWKFRQLFFNGKRQIRARYPNFDPDNPLYGGWAFMEGPDEENNSTVFKFKPGTFPRCWKKPTEAEVNVFWLKVGCTNSIVPIKAIDWEKRTMTLSRIPVDFNRSPWFVKAKFFPNNRFVVENVLEELDQPGEWCLDSEEGVLYFWPPEELTEAGKVVVPALDCLISLQDVSWIRVSGLTFTETMSGDNIHRDGLEGYGAMFPMAGLKYCGEALHMRHTEHCVIEHNRFYAVGGNAIYIQDYAARNVIQHNEISHAGANGVCLIGNKYFNPVPRHPIFNHVENNHIHHCGILDKFAAGVFCGLSDGNYIRYNLIEQMPHHGINLGSSQYGRNFVEYNEIRHTCLETYDNGAINSWGEDPYDHCERDCQRSGHIIRYNYIADTRGVLPDKNGYPVRDIGRTAYGIYLDNNVSNCIVSGNIIVRCGGAGFRLNSGKNNIIENNIIVNTRRAGIFWNCGPTYGPQMGNFMTGNFFCRNIFYYDRSDGEIYSIREKEEWIDRVFGHTDDNLFFNTAGVEYIIDFCDECQNDVRAIPFTEWQRRGYDIRSVVADPMFLDPEHDDYRLKPESPAFKLGFQPIDITKIGLRKE